jgi:hypothetical protein
MPAITVGASLAHTMLAHAQSQVSIKPTEAGAVSFISGTLMLVESSYSLKMGGLGSGGKAEQMRASPDTVH